MTTIYGGGLGFVPEPDGDAVGDLGLNIDAYGDGATEAVFGTSAGTVQSGGERTIFSVVRSNDLNGFKFIDKGPGYLVVGACEESQRVVLLDPTGFRSLKINSISEELSGEIKAMQTTAEYIFVLVADDSPFIRRLYVLENAAGLAVVASFDIDSDEIVFWIAVSEDAGVVAYPAGAGRIELRHTQSPFTLIGSALGIGRSAVAKWFTFPSTKQPVSAGATAPSDYINLWNFGSFSVFGENQTGNETITDIGPEGIVLVQGDTPDGLTPPIRVTPGVSFPDGTGGIYYSTRPASSSFYDAWWERATIDFNGDGAYTLSMYVDGGIATPETPDGDFTFLAQNSSASNGLRVYHRMQWNGGVPIITLHFQCQFDSGVELLSYVQSDPRESYAVTVTQNATRAELYVDGVLVDSVEPVGASAIAIPAEKFTVGGTENKASNDYDMWGAHGQYLYRFNRVLSADEITLLLATHTNTDDDGVRGDYWSGYTPDRFNVGVDGKNITSLASGDGSFVFSNYATIASTLPKYEYQVLLTGDVTDIMFGWGTDLGFNSNYVGQNRASCGWWGGGSVWWNSANQGAMDTFTAGDLVSTRVDFSGGLANTVIGFRKNAGAWTNFNIDFATSQSLADRVYARFGQTDPWGGSAQILTTAAEMAALGNIISAGYVAIPTRGQ